MNQTGTNSLHYSVVRDRGRIYLAVFRKLSQRYGETEAISVMRSASRAHGLEVGASLAHLAPRDFPGMLEEYFKGPDGGATYSPEVKEINDTCLDVHVMTCPLKDGWLDMGCNDEEVCTLLRCATAFDEAVWEEAGFDYELETWAPGKLAVAAQGYRKNLNLRPRPLAAGSVVHCGRQAQLVRSMPEKAVRCTVRARRAVILFSERCATHECPHRTSMFDRFLPRGQCLL